LLLGRGFGQVPTGSSEQLVSVHRVYADSSRCTRTLAGGCES
jgi:hypothetical protein